MSHKGTEKFITIAELSDRWGVSIPTIHLWINRKILPYIDLAPGNQRRTIRIPLEVVEKREKNTCNDGILEQMMPIVRNPALKQEYQTQAKIGE